MNFRNNKYIAIPIVVSILLAFMAANDMTENLLTVSGLMSVFFWLLTAFAIAGILSLIVSRIYSAIIRKELPYLAMIVWSLTALLLVSVVQNPPFATLTG